MKKLITGLVLGLGLLQGAQADTQTQTFDFIVPADSLSYTGSHSFAAFDSNLGTLTGIEFSYYFETHFGYSVTNNGTTAINPVNLSAQEGYFSFGFVTTSGMPLIARSGSITGGNSLFLAPGETKSDSGMSLPASAKGTESVPLPDFLLSMVAGGLNANYEITTPYLAVGARGARGLSFDATSQDLQASMSLSYIYEAAPVPEPESYAMFLAGLGLIGAMARRRGML